jgi:hypothetical protein
VKYQEVVERDREELEILLRSSNKQNIQNALLSAAYYDPEWKWVQSQCLALTHRPQRALCRCNCLGHIASIHRQLDLDLVLQRLTEMKVDPLVSAGVSDAPNDTRGGSGSATNPLKPKEGEGLNGPRIFLGWGAGSFVPQLAEKARALDDKGEVDALPFASDIG